MASLDDVVTQLQGIVSNLSGLTQSDGGIPHGVTGQVLVAQTGTSPYFTSSPTISGNVTIGGNVTCGNMLAATAAFTTSSGQRVTITNDSGYNLLSFNGQTAFPNAIGIEANTGDGQLYLYAQGALQFFNGTGNVASISGSGVGTLINSITPPTGGTSALVMGSVAGFGIYVGTSAPTVAAGTGSLYLRQDGSTTNNRMYVNTNGSTTWTPVTTAA